jgi:hypothetical protein
MSQYDKLIEQGIISDSPGQHDNFNRKLLGEMRAVQDAATSRAKKASDRRTARDAAAMRGYDYWNQGGEGDVAPEDQPVDYNAIGGAVGRYVASQGKPAAKNANAITSAKRKAKRGL